MYVTPLAWGAFLTEGARFYSPDARYIVFGGFGGESNITETHCVSIKFYEREISLGEIVRIKPASAGAEKCGLRI